MQATRSHLIEQFQENVRAIGRKLWLGADQTFLRCKIHPGQARLLYLMHKKGKTTIKELAATLSTTPSAATQLVEGLVEASLVTRTADTKDRRVTWLGLSAKGKQIFSRFHRAHLRRLTELLRPLSTADLVQLTAIQKKLL